MLGFYLHHCSKRWVQNIMKILIFIVTVVLAQGFQSQGFFRTRLSGHRNRLNDQKNDEIKTIRRARSLNYRHLNGKCNQPCQRKPYFVTFESIIEYGHIDKLVGRSILPKGGQNMIDIGLCSGFCKQFQSFLYTDIPVSTKIHHSKITLFSQFRIWKQNVLRSRLKAWKLTFSSMENTKQVQALKILS